MVTHTSTMLVVKALLDYLGGEGKICTMLVVKAQFDYVGGDGTLCLCWW